MNDRERIARAIAQTIADNIQTDIDSVLSAMSRVLHQEADAVLSALDGRIIPELPEVMNDWRIIERYVLMPNQDGTWSALVMAAGDDLIVDGTAATPAAAIRNALGDQP